MRAPSFGFIHANDVETALDALARHGDDAKLLAGGQSLGPMLNYHLIEPAVLVDVSRIPALRVIAGDGAAVSIGASVTQATIGASSEIWDTCPLLAQATRYVAHPAIRERGTIGGSLAHNDPAGEYSSVLLALDAKVRIRSARGERVEDVATLVEERFLETSLEPDELIVEVSVPRRAPHTGHAFLELSERVGDYAIAGAAASVTVNPETGSVVSVRLCGIGGLFPRRLRAAEEELVGGPPSAGRLRAAARAAAADFPAGDDIHATESYRRTLFAVLAFKALAEAQATARG